MDNPELLLASRSPQRRAILEQLGLDFKVVEPAVAEIDHGDPRAVVIGNSLAKARSVEGGRIIGADTAVVLDGRVYGKPADAEEAETWLRRLSGRAHDVWSGIALREDGRERSGARRTRVHFRMLEQDAIDWYLRSEEWRDRAGGYAIQGRGAALVESLEGDYWTVVGLPVPELVRLAPDLFAA